MLLIVNSGRSSDVGDRGKTHIYVKRKKTDSLIFENRIIRTGQPVRDDDSRIFYFRIYENISLLVMF